MAPVAWVEESGVTHAFDSDVDGVTHTLAPEDELDPEFLAYHNDSIAAF